MPKRSNEFQRVVYLVRSALANGATVTESKMLRHRGTNSKREVDICVQGSAGGFPVVVSVECQKRARPADVIWVEGIIKKHEHLPTNRLILVAPQFTSDALTLCELEGVTALTFDTVAPADFQGLLRDATALCSKSITLKVDSVVVRVAPAGELDGERVRASPDQNLYDDSGKYLDTLAPLVTLLVNDPAAKQRLLALGNADHRWFALRWAPPRTATGFALYLQREDAARTLRGIEYVEVSGPCELQVAEFGLRHGKLGDVQVAWGSHKSGGQEHIVVATRDASGCERLTMMVNGSPPSTVEVSDYAGAAQSDCDANNTMYYVVEQNGEQNATRTDTSAGWGRIKSRHVLLLDAVAQCAFLLRNGFLPGNGGKRLAIVQAAHEAAEGAILDRGTEVNVFDAAGTPARSKETS